MKRTTTSEKNEKKIKPLKNPKRPGRPENLKMINTTERAKELGSKGGIKSAETRRQRRLMSQIYADFLTKKHTITDRQGVRRKLTGEELLANVMSRVLARGDSSSVSLMKEIREAIEGSNVHLDADIGFESYEEKKKRLREKLERVANDND